jgi:queuine tRNA-ribosyltransferase
MKEAQTQIILANTYHLMLQPGADLVQKMGGLHKFMGWEGPILTDSGGFQVFSLGHGSVASEVKGRRGSHRPKSLVKITEEGAAFRSYINGSPYLLTPEKSMEIQSKLGADLVVVFDECTPFHVPYSYTESSTHMSHRWAVRSLEAFKTFNQGAQALYGIVQGGVYPELRQVSTDFVNSQPFFGHAIGGSLGADKKQMYEVVNFTAPLLDPSRPIHLLGIGGIGDIFNGVFQGIDTFDCVHPTRLARHGGALVRGGDPDHIQEGREHLNLRNSRFREDASPIEGDCPCATCRTFSRAYLHHLLKAQELFAIQAITLHNVTFMNRLLAAIRQGIQEGNLLKVQKTWSP